MLKINSYQFGEIQINERIYTSDVIIFPDRVQANWWRKEGHRLASEDLNTIFVHKPAIDLLLIGTGAYGAMKILQSVIKHLNGLGIETISGVTKEICEKHNRLGDAKTKFATALHLAMLTSIELNLLWYCRIVITTHLPLKDEIPAVVELCA